VERAHELNRRIKNNPCERLRVIQEFYSEMVEAGERETAELVLVIQSMMDDHNPALVSKRGFCHRGAYSSFLHVAGDCRHLGARGSQWVKISRCCRSCPGMRTLLGLEIAIQNIYRMANAR